MKKAAIIGVGLMGGSLGLALRRRRPRGWHVVGVGRKTASLRQARRLGLIDEGTTDWAEGVRNADIVVVATPVDRIVPIIKKIRAHLPSGALIMDIGSAKAEIVAAAAPLFRGEKGPAFVGVHPMTGSEKTGFRFARADLYRGAACILTPTPQTPSAALKAARYFWRQLGARVLEMPPAAHDEWMAIVSHLPHLIADAFILAAHRKPGAPRKIRDLSAGSFRDMTRVAGADPEQWRAIFSMNEANLGRAARNFIKCLEGLMKNKFPIAELRKARARRGALAP